MLQHANANANFGRFLVQLHEIATAEGRDYKGNVFLGLPGVLSVEWLMFLKDNKKM